MKILSGFIIVVLIGGCIGEDFVDDFIEPKLELSCYVDSLKIGDAYTLVTRYLNNVGLSVAHETEWSSSNPSVISITSSGVVSALQAGTAEVTVMLSADNSLFETILIVAGEVTSEVKPEERIGSIVTTSSYQLQGDFVVKSIEGGIAIEIMENYRASTALPGLYIYLTNNPNTNSGALEIGAVKVFSGTHSYQIIEDDIDINTYDYILYYCKPFAVKVGDGQIND